MPSDSQSQRTWIPLSGSWSSKTIAVKLTRVSVSAGKGDQVKFTYGGALGGGGGASYVRFTSADGDGFPALSQERARIVFPPTSRSIEAFQIDRPSAGTHGRLFTRTSTLRRPLPPASEATPETEIRDA